MGRPLKWRSPTRAPSPTTIFPVALRWFGCRIQPKRSLLIMAMQGRFNNGTMRIPAFSLLLLLSALNALSADVKLDLHLIWGTSEQTSPNSEHKPISQELKKKLQELPLKWTNYFEV